MKNFEYVQAVAEELNITRAAERLHITQPVLTRFLNKLEKENGAILFNRKKSPIEITEAGRIFLNEQAAIVAKEQRLRRMIAMVGNKQTTVHFGFSDSWDFNVVSPALSKFVLAHPNLSLKLTIASDIELPYLIENGKVDLAIGSFDIHHANVKHSHIGPEMLGIVAPLSLGILPKELDCAATLKTPYSIEEHNLNNLPVIVSMPSTISYSSYHVLMNLYNIRPSTIIYANSVPVRWQMCLAGAGYTFSTLPSSPSALKNNQGNYAVAICKLPNLPLRILSTLAYRSDHPGILLLQELSESILNEYRGRSKDMDTSIF